MDEGLEHEDNILTPYKYLMKKHAEGYDFHTAERIIQSIFSPGNEKWDNSGLNAEIVDNLSLSDDQEYDEDDIDSDLSQSDNKDETVTTQLELSYQHGKVVRRLREPRDLYTGVDESSFFAPPRWPVEMQVIENGPNHIDSTVQTLKKFYNSGSNRHQSSHKPVRAFDSDSDIVYLIRTGSMVRHFIRSNVGGSAIKPSQQHHTSKEDVLSFESRFESGNLEKAVRVGPYEYELILSNDLYTHKHTQWYYFRVSNAIPGVEYTFTIINLTKSDSLYNHGMQPILYSELEARQNGIGWIRCGYDIQYYKNEINREGKYKNRTYYSLTWKIRFKHANDTCYFAHCYPYTYSKLQQYLQQIINDENKKEFCKLRVLCQSIAGNHVYLMTVTSPSSNSLAKPKRTVIVTARVHPGEVNSSWVMKGFIDYITGSTDDALLLREMFIFKIIPMINPDGVIVGNYRCSLIGRDLNRTYNSNLATAYPPVYHIRKLVQKLLKEREVILYCDLHGHSKKQNSFMYGCENRLNRELWLKERIFPSMMSKNAKDLFSYSSCKFKVQKYKEGTARVTMWRLGIMNSFTFETSFCGSTLGPKSGQQFTTHDFELLGAALCDTILDYCDPDHSKVESIYCDLVDDIKEKLLQKFKDKDKDTDINEKSLRRYLSEVESDTQGSNSSLSDGSIVNIVVSDGKKVKKLRSRKERSQRRHQHRESNVRPHTADHIARQNNELLENRKLVAVEFKPSNGHNGKLKRFIFRRDIGKNNKRTTDGVPIYVQERLDERAAKKESQNAKLPIQSSTKHYKAIERNHCKPPTNRLHNVKSCDDIESLLQNPPPAPVLSLQEFPSQLEHNPVPPTAYSRSLTAYGAHCLRGKSAPPSKRNEDLRSDAFEEEWMDSKNGYQINNRALRNELSSRAGGRQVKTTFDLQLQKDPLVKNATLNSRDSNHKSNYTPSPHRPTVYRSSGMNASPTTTISREVSHKKVNMETSEHVKLKLDKSTNNYNNRTLRPMNHVYYNHVALSGDALGKLEVNNSTCEDSMASQLFRHQVRPKLSTASNYSLTTVQDLRRALSIQK